MEIKEDWIREGSVAGISCYNEQKRDKNAFILYKAGKKLQNNDKDAGCIQ